ncbi:MAG: hypothetical protein KKC84_05560, partial [Candidatus Omnitrophica bacterium]|nr:hypothetical protein [Candidatus Omnitrophota bacterium]
QSDSTKHKHYTLLEERLQLKTNYYLGDNGILEEWQSVFRFKGDFTVDGYFGEKTAFELREAYLSTSPDSILDIKLGRQILTWGTGDYLFINDVFPKDYVSFYAGRDDEYLKKPSDALRFSLYPSFANIDFVLIPVFEPNTIPVGDRLSFFDSFQGGIAGRQSDRHLIEPAVQPNNIEYALRIYKNFSGLETALYFFRGFDHMPRSYKNEALRQLYYQRQDVYGLSVRGAFAGGIANAEAGYIRSPEDSRGTNRLIENSAFKFLTGYEKDLGNDWKLGVQYYYEQKLNYGAYARALFVRDYRWDEYRHLMTQRVTKLFKNQTVVVSLFNFYSPSDRDGYLRGLASYDITDRWKLSFGMSIPWGEDVLTDFGSMQKDKNVFVRVRYSY